jgi:hypothetical protein
MWHAWAKRNTYRVYVGKPEGKRHYEDLDIGGRILLRWYLEKLCGWYALD